MTTASSPIEKLAQQAITIAKHLKRLEPDATIGNALKIKFCVAMDDKLLIIDMPRATIREATVQALTEFVLKQMQEKRDDG